MIVHRISFHKNRFYAVRDNSRRAIAGSLLGANPVFAASSSFGANICETIAKDLTIAPLTLNVGYVRLGNVAILSGLSSWTGWYETRFNQCFRGQPYVGRYL